MLSSKPMIFEVHELVKDISNDLRSLWELLHYAGQCKSDSELPNDVRLFTPEEWEQIAITLAHWRTLMEECNSLLVAPGKPARLWPGSVGPPQCGGRLLAGASLRPLCAPCAPPSWARPPPLLPSALVPPTSAPSQHPGPAPPPPPTNLSRPGAA